MDGRGQAHGDRKGLYLMASLSFLNSINVFVYYRVLVIAQACMMSFPFTFTYLLLRLERSACFPVWKERCVRTRLPL